MRLVFSNPDQLSWLVFIFIAGTVLFAYKWFFVSKQLRFLFILRIFLFAIMLLVYLNPSITKNNSIESNLYWNIYLDKSLSMSYHSSPSINSLLSGIDDIINRAPNKQAPYVGDSAFSTKAGIHASAIVKDPKTYEHVEPHTIGNERKLLISDQGGKSNIVATLNNIGIKTHKEDQRIAELLNIVKEREAAGYTYESALASFEILSRQIFGQETEFFKVESFRTMVERRNNAKGELITVSEATVKVEVDGERYMSSGEGNGPINALDNALRKDLGKFNKYLKNMELVDYKVRVLSGGTSGVTRVLVESADTKTKERWVTIGVSPNIVDASFQALFDAINYKLVNSKVIDK